MANLGLSLSIPLSASVDAAGAQGNLHKGLLLMLLTYFKRHNIYIIKTHTRYLAKRYVFFLLFISSENCNLNIFANFDCKAAVSCFWGSVSIRAVEIVPKPS